jgi:RNA-directed DNA polymerase
VLLLVKAFLKAGVLTEHAGLKESDTGTPQGGLCSAEHKPPNAQCWLMCSAGLPGLVVAVSEGERCA